MWPNAFGVREQEILTRAYGVSLLPLDPGTFLTFRLSQSFP